MDDKIKLKEEQEAFKVFFLLNWSLFIFRDKSVYVNHLRNIVYLFLRLNYAQCKKQHSGEDPKVTMTIHNAMQALLSRCHYVMNQ